jgi:transposase
MHSLEKELEGYYLKGAFWELAKHDKINNHKNKPFLVKLDRLFYTLKKHIKLRDKIENADSFSNIKTTYSTHANFIQPTINAYETTLEDDRENDSLTNKVNILNVYKEEPLAVAMAIQASSNSDYNFLYENMNKKDFQDLNKRIVSFKLKLSKKDVAKSLQLHIISLYKNDSIHNQLLKDTPH